MMKIQARWQALKTHPYLPQYRLPRFASCFLLAFFLSILVVGLLIFLAGPMLLAYLAEMDTSPTAPMLQIQLGAELTQENIQLRWNSSQTDGGHGYWLEFEKIDTDSSGQTFSFYYLPGLTETWAIPGAGYLRLHRLDGETLELQWVLVES